MTPQEKWDEVRRKFNLVRLVEQFQARLNMSDLPSGEFKIEFALITPKNGTFGDSTNFIMPVYGSDTYPFAIVRLTELDDDPFWAFRAAHVIRALAESLDVDDALLQAATAVTKRKERAGSPWIPQALGSKFEAVMARRIPADIVQVAVVQVWEKNLAPEVLTLEAIAGTISWDESYESALGALSPADYLRDKELQAKHEKEYGPLVADLIQAVMEPQFEHTLLHSLAHARRPDMERYLLDEVLEALRRGVDEEYVLPVAIARIISSGNLSLTAMSHVSDLEIDSSIEPLVTSIVGRTKWADCAVATLIALDFSRFEVSPVDLANTVFDFITEWPELESVPFVRRETGELVEEEEAEEDSQEG